MSTLRIVPKGSDKSIAELRAIPHSTEAEQAVLGALLISNDAWDAVAELVTANDFYHREHRQIFEVMSELAQANTPIDVVPVIAALESLGVLEKVGGKQYLMELSRNTPSSANVEAYAKVVRERSVLRQLIEAANRIADKSFNTEGVPSAEVLDMAEKEIFKIAEQNQKGSGPRGVKNILAKTVERLEELFRNKGAITGITTGFQKLDEMTSGLQPSDMVIVAGRPSMGKTTFAMNLCETAALKSGKPVLVFSMEMPAESLMMRMLASLGRINLGKILSGNLSQDDWSRITSAMQMLTPQKFYIDDTPSLSPLEVRARARRVARECGGELGMIMIDYLQLMQVPGVENRVNEISEISRSLKALAKELNVPVIALSQLNRSLEQRPNKRPVMSDLRESGAIEQDADLIMFLYREEVYSKEKTDDRDKGIGEVIIGKQRNGPIGTVRLAFRGEFTRFDDLAHDSYAQYQQDE